MSGKIANLCPVCSNAGKKCGEQGAVSYYHQCSVCDTVWLSDRSEYDKAKKDIYDEDYVTKMYGAEGIKGYRRLAERYFYLLHFISGAMGKRLLGPLKFAEIGFSLPSVIKHFFNYGHDVTALDMRVSEKIKRDLSPLVETRRLHSFY